MKHKNLVLGTLALLLVSLSASTTISQENITIDLEDDHVTVEMFISQLTTDSFNYQTTHPVNSLDAFFNGERKSCEINELAVGSEINCDTELRENFTVRLEYTASGLTSTEGNVQIFSYSQPIYRPVNNYTLRVLLPEGKGLVDRSNTTTPVIQPENGETGSIGGRRFYVEWNSRAELGETIRFQLLYEDLQKTQSFNFLPFIGLGLVLVLAYVVYRRKTEVQASSILEDISTDQRMVLDLLRENEGEMLQKDIVEESDYSKAKISGVVKELEEEGIVTKEKEGRSNKVDLKKKFMD